MRSTYLVMISLLATSCASYKSFNVISKKSNVPTQREPSSSVSESNLNISFDIIMNSQNPSNEFNSYLNRLKSLYLRTENYLSEFDKELDVAVSDSAKLSFENSNNYKKLIVMWDLSHRLEDKIIFHYLKLTDIASDHSASLELRAQAKAILKDFKRKLDSKDPIEKLTFDSLKSNIAMALIERRGETVKGFSTNLVPIRDFKSEGDKILTLRKMRNQMREDGKIQNESHDDLSLKIEADAAKLQFADNSGRDPQSELKFFPSTGPNGNIMGLVFPKNVWALTYDDGPNPVHTPAILKNLEELGIKATFFWLAENVIRYQSIVDDVKEKGMVRANHSWSHAQLPKLDTIGLQKEIVQSTQIEERSYGEKVKYFRCPYGAGNSVPRIRQMISELDMIHVFWNVDTLDWQDKDPESIVARARKQMQSNGHGVVLFHDIHPQSVIASKKLVEWSKTLKGTENEIRWVTIPEIVAELNGASK